MGLEPSHRHPATHTTPELQLDPIELQHAPSRLGKLKGSIAERTAGGPDQRRDVLDVHGLVPIPSLAKPLIRGAPEADR